jgi:PAS domain S-box-containing protein
LLALNRGDFRLLRYLLPVVSVALAVGLGRMVGVLAGPEAAPFELEETLLLLLFAVMVSAWFGGVGSGLLAVLLSLLVSDYLLLQPLRSLLDFNPGQGPLLGTFLVEGVAICAFIAVLRGLKSRQRETEQEYRTVVETASDAVITINEAGEIRFANRAAEKIFGRSRSEMIGQSLTSLMSEQQQRRHEAAFRRYLETGERTVNWESLCVTGLHASGREVPLEVSYAEHFRDGYRYFTGFIRDISDRRRAEAELRESEQRFRTIFDGAAIGIARVAPDGRILESNSALQEMFGYEAGELRNRRFGELVHPDDLPEELDPFRELAEGQSDRYRTEKRYLRKDGEPVWTNLTVSLVRGEDAEPLFYIAMVEDVTERKRAVHRLMMQYAVSRVLAENPSFEEAIPQLLQTIGEGLNWSLGAFWRLDRPAGELRCEHVREREPADRLRAGERAAGARVGVG